MTPRRKKAARRGRGRGLGYAGADHFKIGNQQADDARTAFVDVVRNAEQGNCYAAIVSLDAGSRAYGQALAHSISTGDDKDVDSFEDRIETIDRIRIKAQGAIRRLCLRTKTR